MKKNEKPLYKLSESTSIWEQKEIVRESWDVGGIREYKVRYEFEGSYSVC